MVSLFAFLHHVAAFTLVATLAVEFVLVGGELTLHSARKLQVTDLIFGISASIILVVGFLRVFYFEKGPAYYFHSVPFIAKISLFVAVGLLSIYPTLQFLSWRKSLREGLAPVVSASTMRTIQSIILWELAGVVLIILCAVLMARGVGVVGG
jgi:putative membrane protein